MKINMEALKTLEAKLAEYSKENGTIAVHESLNNNCERNCAGTCSGGCYGGCLNTSTGAHTPHYGGLRK